MIKHYAQIDPGTGECFAVSMLAGEVINDNLIEQPDFSDTRLGQRRDKAAGKWEKFNKNNSKWEPAS